LKQEFNNVADFYKIVLLKISNKMHSFENVYFLQKPNNFPIRYKTFVQEKKQKKKRLCRHLVSAFSFDVMKYLNKQDRDCKLLVEMLWTAVKESIVTKK
jgi:hypothetical protein